MPDPVPAVSSVPAVVFDGARVTYPGAASEALCGISLTIPAGQHVCVLGGNGSGKSTFLQLINALILPTDGQVRTFGINTADPAQTLAIRSRAVCVFQQPGDQLVASTVADDVAFGPENLRIPQPDIVQRVEDALAAVQMERFAAADPAALSGGQQQRTALAGALAMQPSMLLLDEPAAMLDAAGRAAVRRIVDRAHRAGITVVHVTHFMEDALRADRVIVLERGHVALDGAPEAVFAEHDRIRALGLDMPFAARVAERLEAQGLALPPCVTGCGELAATLAAQLSGRADGGDPASAASKAARRADAPAAIVFEHVSFTYHESGTGWMPARAPRRRILPWRRRSKAPAAPRAVDDLTFSVPAGSLTALIGHTGSGKSTALELACALKLPSAGTVRVNGIDTADRTRRRELRRAVGYVAQLPERQLFAETVREDVSFGPRNLGLAPDEIEHRVREALEAVGLPATETFLQHSPFALSGGQQRGVAIAGVLAMQPAIIVLDEPMAGLDPAGRERMRALLRHLKERGTTLLLVTHDMDDVAELADQVIALAEGHLAAVGTPAAVFAAIEHAEAGSPLAALGAPSACTLSAALRQRGVHLQASPLTLDDVVQEVASHALPR